MSHEPRGLLAHRERVRSHLASRDTATVYRDTAAVSTEWGPIARNKAVYAFVKGEWRVVVDEFGTPTLDGVEYYDRFRPSRKPRRLRRIANKNQLQIVDRGVVQLAPATWTTRFRGLARLFDAMRYGKATPVPQRLGDERRPAPFDTALPLEAPAAARQRISSATRRLESLDAWLRAALLVFDSDLGKPTDPFIQIDEVDPSVLCTASAWRSWSGGWEETDCVNLVEMIAKPSVHWGWDLYRRPIVGEDYSARAHHLCVVEIDAASVGESDLAAVDYAKVWQAIVGCLDDCQTGRHPRVRAADGYLRADKVHALRTFGRFWARFYSYSESEVLIRGDLPVERVFKLVARGSDDDRGPVLEVAVDPLWESGDRITRTAREQFWSARYFPSSPR